ELKSFLKSGLVSLDLDPAAVYQFFHFQYVPDPGSIVREVRKLPAAHMLIVHTQPWRVETQQYWRFDAAEPIEGEPASVLEGQLDEVSQLVVRSDVPVGLALSGGVDSAVV